jgi:hypothetical protein
VSIPIVASVFRSVFGKYYLHILVGVMKVYLLTFVLLTIKLALSVHTQRASLLRRHSSCAPLTLLQVSRSS